jgi:transposase
MVLWEQRLDDALAQDHPVRQFLYLLNSAAFAETFTTWETEYVLLEGKPPFHPRDLTGLYLYGMLNGIRSSRRLEASCSNRLDVIWLMQGQCPDHSTIADFVKGHKKFIRQLFKDALQVAIKAGLVKLNHVAVDGTKIEANAGKKSVKKETELTKELAGIDEQIEALESEWAANEVREANLFGKYVPWTPESALSDRQKLAKLKRRQDKLQKALAELARRRQESTESKSIQPINSTTDPESRVMPDKEGRCKPNYNSQLGTDGQCGYIVAEDVTDQASDGNLLLPMVGQVQSNGGRLPDEASADSQYNTGHDVKELELQGVTTYLPETHTRSQEKTGTSDEEVALRKARSGQELSESEWQALPRDDNGRIRGTAFGYDTQQDVYRCPAGQILTFLRTTCKRKKTGVIRRREYGGCSACAACPQAALCGAHPQKGRRINREEYEEYRERLRARMNTDHGRARYRLRRQTVEPRFGEIKQIRGVRRFLRRGLEAVKTEWSLICTSVDVGILLRHWEKVVVVL